MSARILVSRNKREGGYLGRGRSVYDRDYNYEGRPRNRNHRKGAGHWKTLREWNMP